MSPKHLSEKSPAVAILPLSARGGEQLHRIQSSMCQLTGVAILVFLTSMSVSAQRKTIDAPPDEHSKELAEYPLNDFGEVLIRLQKEVALPAPRQESRLLPLLPSSTVFYAAIPNYGEAAKQALKIFRQEREARPELRKWWHSPEMAKNGPQFEMGIDAASNLAQYLGDEIVIAGSLNGSKSPNVVLLAEVRKPGLKEALDFAVQVASAGSKPPMRVLDKAGLAGATESTPRQLTVLVRPDFVIAGGDLETVRNFSRELDTGKHGFPATEFGRRLQQGYSGGVSVLAGADLQVILSRVPLTAQQTQMLERTGFADVKYAVWEHRGLPGQPSSEAELSFTRPRRGVASWLAAPRNLRSLDFASPHAILVASIGLKNLGSIFDEIRAFATAANPNALAQMDQMQQGMGINLKDDLLSQLGGEISLEVDDVKKDQAAWKAILQVNDAARLQQTFTKLLAMAPMQAQVSQEDGITYHTLTAPSPARPMEIGYAFADGYLVIGSSNSIVHDAVRLHRNGGSLAKSSAFLASLPPGHSTQASALYYQDVLSVIGMQLSRLSPEIGNSIFHGLASSPAVTCAYADDRTIRGASVSQTVDLSTILIAAAVAIPNLSRARNSANEASAAASLRTMVTAQMMYASAYPGRGYARDLARLGPDPADPHSISPLHAGFIDASLAKPSCTTGSWCEKSGYRFTFSPVCAKLLCQEFVAIATPVASAAGTRNFCATSDGVVRFRVEAPLMAPLLPAQCRAWQPLE